MGDRPSGDGYRPPRQIPPADRPHGNEPFCESFSSPLPVAVGAGDTLRALPRDPGSLVDRSSPRIPDSAIPMYLASDYIHPYKSAVCLHARCRARSSIEIHWRFIRISSLSVIDLRRAAKDRRCEAVIAVAEWCRASLLSSWRSRTLPEEKDTDEEVSRGGCQR